MSILGRKWPVPVAKPMWPFFTAGAIILYAVNGIQNAMVDSDDFRNDPRNPNAKNNHKKPADKH